MKTTIPLFLALLLLSCASPKAGEKPFSEYKTEFYYLYTPSTEINGVLVIFGGTGQIIESTKKEFPIVDEAIEKGIAVLYLNFNRKLWLEKEYKDFLKESMEGCFKRHQLNSDNIFIGGFSGGGNMTLLISDFLHETNSEIAPKGLFIVDSPVDLLELCLNAERNLERNFHPLQMQEAEWIVNLMHSQLGDPKDGIENYETYSPFTARTSNIENLKHLNGTKIRLYTEADTLWWRENRGNSPEEMNAHWIEKLSNQLNSDLPTSKVELIKTHNKGYRANGDRHPHSWSIVNKKELLDWIFE